MPYSEKASSLRRCRASTKSGAPCRAWALWGNVARLCLFHAGRHHRGPLLRLQGQVIRAQYEPCRCEAYAWPHRPGGGLCRWPDEPLERCDTPAGGGERARSMRRRGSRIGLRSAMRGW